MLDIIIEKGSKLLGISKTNMKNIFKDKTDDESIKLLNDIESLSMIGISQRLNLSELYNSFISEYMHKIISTNTRITIENTFNDEQLIKEIFNAASNKAKEKFVKWIQDNNKSIKINYRGKNITSRCSKLPHVPHYDNENKTFCCGVHGDIELINYTIRITSVINKINGNRSRRSTAKGAYRIHILESDHDKLI